MTTPPQPPLGEKKLDKLLTRKEKKKLNQLINQLPKENPIITADDLNSILSDLEQKRFYTLLVLIVVLDLNYNITQAAASKKYEEHQIHLCLNCFSFFRSNKELTSHLQNGPHFVSCAMIKKNFSKAQKGFKEIRKRNANANQERDHKLFYQAARNRLLTLTERICLEKVISPKLVACR